MRRRQALALVTGSLSLVAGCSSDTTTDLTPTPSKTGTEITPESQIRELPMTTPPDPIDCDDDPRPVSRAAGDSYPDRANEFELTASKGVVTIGERITFTLTNIGDNPRGIGEKYKYNILRQHDGWEPIYFTESQAGWTDLGVRVYPGGGFRWTFTATNDGLERQNGYNPAYHVCSALEPGEYRFAFFGLGGSTISTTFMITDA